MRKPENADDPALAGQPHAHLAYDDGAFDTVFLRPVMPSASDTSVTADFVLAPA